MSPSPSASPHRVVSFGSAVTPGSTTDNDEPISPSSFQMGRASSLEWSLDEDTHNRRRRRRGKAMATGRKSHHLICCTSRSYSTCSSSVDWTSSPLADRMEHYDNSGSGAGGSGNGRGHVRRPHASRLLRAQARNLRSQSALAGECCSKGVGDRDRDRGTDCRALGGGGGGWSNQSKHMSSFGGMSSSASRKCEDYTGEGLGGGSFGERGICIGASSRHGGSKGSGRRGEKSETVGEGLGAGRGRNRRRFRLFKRKVSVSALRWGSSS